MAKAPARLWRWLGQTGYRKLQCDIRQFQVLSIKEICLRQYFYLKTYQYIHYSFIFFQFGSAVQILWRFELYKKTFNFFLLYLTRVRHTFGMLCWQS